MKIEVTVHGPVPDSKTDQQILILRQKNGDEGKFLPIWIGNSEADSIKIAIEETRRLDRPLTHDLLKNMLNYFRTPLQKVVIHKLIQGTFFAHLYINNHGTDLLIDCRPSDAIALAIRLKAPVFIEEEIYVKQQISLKDKKNIEKINLES